MRPRVHRHLIGQIEGLVADLRGLPDHPILSESYQEARTMMHDEISLAMKYSMRADVYFGKAEGREGQGRALNRKAAADSWWGWRRAISKARLYHGIARIFLEFDQEIER